MLPSLPHLVNNTVLQARLLYCCYKTCCTHQLRVLPNLQAYAETIVVLKSEMREPFLLREVR
jgi:hypothetical protein